MEIVDIKLEMALTVLLVDSKKKKLKLKEANKYVELKMMKKKSSLRICSRYSNLHKNRK